MPMNPTLCAQEAVAKVKEKFPGANPDPNFWKVIAEVIIEHIQRNAVTSGGQTIL